MVTAGERRDRVSIQARTETSDGHDGYTETWSTLRSRWSARVRPLSGRDLERARTVDPRVTHEVVFGWWHGWRDDLDGGRARLLFHPTSVSDDDIEFEIVTPPVDVEGKRENVLVLAKEAA
jgi:head-tail adaptor